MMRLRGVLLVGVGQIFPFHVEAIRNVLPDVEVFATDKKTGRRKAAERLGASFVSGKKLDSVMGKIDVVIDCTPAKERLDVGLPALMRGKSLILEKPPAETLSQFDLLFQQAKDNKVLLYCSLHASFGREVIWLAEQMKKEGEHLHYGQLVEIRSFFSDPYVKDGFVVSPLGGSWFDSGINALSVIAKFVSGIEIVSANFFNRIPAAQGLLCRDSERKVHFTFTGGKGEITTTWIFGEEMKHTLLKFRKNNKDTFVLLDHSTESVWVGLSEIRLKHLMDLRTDKPRLVNHYIGVYRDFLKNFEIGADNAPLGRRLTAFWETAGQSV
ncbi:MAG: Gfo/Idh/MocA family oxidoreductase [Candidatus Portnoybacteria bacterium]|nr:Gfo/Idh/MocA family oxidoreductase [Candidatus Portnoybacteria bacterium]